MEVTLKSIGPDGLYWWYLEGRPWLHREEMFGWAPFIITETQEVIPTRNARFDRFTEPLMLYRIISAMTIYSLRDPDSAWDAALRTMVDRLVELAINRDNHSFYPC